MSLFLCNKPFSFSYLIVMQTKLKSFVTTYPSINIQSCFFHNLSCDWHYVPATFWLNISFDVLGVFILLSISFFRKLFYLFIITCNDSNHLLELSSSSLSWYIQWPFCLYFPYLILSDEVFVSHIWFYWQVSVGYFIADVGMILWFFPSLGGYEYVRIISF